MRISDWSSDVCSSDLRDRNCRKAKGPHPPAMGFNLQQRPHGGAQRYLQGRSRQGTRLPKHPYLHLHDLSDRCTARRHPQIHVKRRGAEMERIDQALRSEEHTSELQSLMRISYAVFCLKKKNKQT